MNRHGGTIAAALALALAATTARAATTEQPRENCFPAGSWRAWSAADHGDVLYFRVHTNSIYRVDLSPGSHVYKTIGYFLVNEVRGSNWICRPTDLNLSLRSNYGFEKPLIAVSMRKLTPTEVAAIPRRDLP
jgi:hypothetical protein